MIAVALRLVAHPHAADELRRRVREDLIPATRAERGCIDYRFYQDIEDPRAFSFVEEWESRDTLDAHFRSSHVGGFLAALGELLAEAPVARFYEVAQAHGLEAVEQARAELSA